MKKGFVLLAIVLFLGSCENKIDRKNAYVPESSGNLNHVTVVMPESDWNANLGNSVREALQQTY